MVGHLDADRRVLHLHAEDGPEEAPREERLGILRCLAGLPGPSDVQVVVAARLARLEAEGR